MSPPWFATLPFLYFLDFSLKEHYHAARFEKDTRYYVIRLEKDLFDDWIITLVNGRIKSKLGQIRTLFFPSFSETYTQFCDMAKLRYQRGYHLKTFNSGNPLFLHLLYFSFHSKCHEAAPTTKEAMKVTRITNKNIRPSIVNGNPSQPTHQQIGFTF